MKLKDFHLLCKKEYNTLINHYNILFYGYGNKKNILSLLFPNGIQFNCKFYTFKDILMHLNSINESKHSSLQQMDKNLKKKIILILFNFNFNDKHHFKDLKNIQLIFTLERIDDFVDVEDLNIIYRDLTTFEDYDEDLVDIQIDTEYDNKSILKVVSNVPKNSRTVLKEIILSNKSCIDVSEVFELVKKKLMIFSKNAIFTLISEFIDHKILKIKDKTILIVNFSKKQYPEILECIEKS